MNIFRLRKEPDLSGMAADLGDTLLEQMNAPAPEKANEGIAGSREDLEHTIKRIDADTFEKNAAIGRVDAEIARQHEIKVGLKQDIADLAKRRKQARDAIAILDKATADIDALANAEAKPKQTAKRSRKAETVEA
jgi:hypothetical protein